MVIPHSDNVTFILCFKISIRCLKADLSRNKDVLPLLMLRERKRDWAHVIWAVPVSRDSSSLPVKQAQRHLCHSLLQHAPAATYSMLLKRLRSGRYSGLMCVHIWDVGPCLCGLWHHFCGFSHCRYPTQPCRFGKLLLLLPALLSISPSTIEEVFFKKTIGNVPITRLLSDMYKSSDI